MKFKVLTLFPEMVLGGLRTSITGKAIENNLITLETVNIRDYTQDKHGKVDDYTYGGGAGMLMQAQPVYDAWRAVAGEALNGKCDCGEQVRRIRTIYVTPQGRLFTQDYARKLAEEEELIFLCGHYEGVDQRVLDEIVTDYVSIGDYVLTGGELPAMVMIDAISRLVPGVLHNEESAETETFYRHLLEYPQYSRPEVWHDKEVPKLLLSGDHRKIAAWRLEQSERITRERRPELYAAYERQEAVIKQLSLNKRLHIHMMENLRRGRGEVLFARGGAVAIYDSYCKMGLFTLEAAGTKGQQEDVRQEERQLAAKKMQVAIEMFAAIPDHVWKEMELAVTTGEELNRELLRGERFQSSGGTSFYIVSECLQACYTQKNPLPVRHKDIRLLDENALAYLTAHYEHDGEAYLAERLRSKALFGAFVDGKLVGFAGWHSDGSIGFRFVEEGYRRKEIGTSLEAFCINRQLEMGFVPYGHIDADNTVSVQIQKKLGLYLSKERIWWLERQI
ncbi:MAG: tRNA (guanosine(37)-N1)-methyltransferase TrmD [Lachnospiraceae bacterium]|nr:tRNA (guanosine(37)-N1)-methyltransferase TrmD [Lachnospiraceae bacterium]